MSDQVSSLPHRPSLEQLRKQAKELLRLCRAHDSDALRRIRAAHPALDRKSNAEIQLADAQLALAREYGFATWGALKQHVQGEVQRPADFDERSWGADSWPFLAAVQRGDLASVVAMLERDRSLVAAEYAYRQPLHFAVKSGRTDMVKLLLDAGADPLAEGWSNRLGNDTPLRHAEDRGLNEVVALLRAAAERPRAPLPERKHEPPDEWRVLEDEMERICHEGDVPAAREMHHRHTGIAQAGLYEAVHQGYLELTCVLIELGADPTKPWRWACWYTPLMHCLRYGKRGFLGLSLRKPRYELAELLLKNDVDPNEANGLGMAALHVLAMEGTPEAIKWLVGRGAFVDCIDGDSNSTPLGWAARFGRDEIVRTLLDLGARASLPLDQPWAAPAAWARRRGHDHIIDLLDRVSS